MKFSDVITDAKEKGFTEPDPRDDLSGTDVARKVTILARACGIEVDLDSIPVSSLVPGPLQDWSPAEGEVLADAFIKEQQKLMRRGVPEEEAYRRVKQQQAEKRRVDDAEATLAQQQAQSLGLSPAARSAATASSADTAAPGERTREGFAARLLRRFAEEARAGGGQNASWSGSVPGAVKTGLGLCCANNE